MNATDQGTREPGKRRYQVIPRTLIFLTSSNPQNGEREVLLLKGAPTKRLWANRYNGLGGHIEANEDVYQAAQREVWEETGLRPTNLTLCGVINIDTGADAAGQRPGVLILVFRGESPERTIQATPEGLPEWIPISAVSHYPLVDDLYELLPRVLSDHPFLFGHYTPQPDGTLHYRFR